LTQPRRPRWTAWARIRHDQRTRRLRPPIRATERASRQWPLRKGYASHRAGLVWRRVPPYRSRRRFQILLPACIGHETGRTGLTIPQGPGAEVAEVLLRPLHLPFRDCSPAPCRVQGPLVNVFSGRCKLVHIASLQGSHFTVIPFDSPSQTKSCPYTPSTSVLCACGIRRSPPDREGSSGYLKRFSDGGYRATGSPTSTQDPGKARSG